MIVIYFILIVCVLIASIYDATTQRIPNWIVLVITLSGLSWNYFSADGLSLSGSTAGLITGLLLMLPGYVFASMGAGDVKFMAAIGSVVGFDYIINIAICSYMAIFVMAIAFIIVKGDLFKLLHRYKALFCGLFVGALHYQEPVKSDAASYQLPLAPAIALATCYVLYSALPNSGFMVNLWH